MRKVLITCSICNENRVISEIRLQQIINTVGIRQNKCRSCARKESPSIPKRGLNRTSAELVCPNCRKTRKVSPQHTNKVISKHGTNEALCHICANVNKKIREINDNLKNGYIEIGKCRLYPSTKGRPEECVSKDWEEKLCEYYSKCCHEVGKLDWDGWSCELKENYK